MDTDQLSNEAYQAIIITAEKFHHDLTLKFGLLSYDCEDENEYLQSSKKLIGEWNKKIRIAIGDIFFENPPESAAFKIILQTIIENILKVEEIPFEDRRFDKW